MRSGSPTKPIRIPRLHSGRSGGPARQPAGGHCKSLFLKDKKGGFWLAVMLEEAPAEQTKEEEVLASDAPSRAHREIAELGRLVGGVPALHNEVEALRPFFLAVALEPLRLDQAAAQRARRLLILPAKLYWPIVRRMRSRVSSGSRSGCKASP
jgi:hypothetical protein